MDRDDKRYSGSSRSSSNSRRRVSYGSSSDRGVPYSGAHSVNSSHVRDNSTQFESNGGGRHSAGRHSAGDSGGYSRSSYRSAGDSGRLSSSSSSTGSRRRVSDEARSYSRESSAERYSAERASKPKKKIGLIVAIVLGVILLVAAIAGGAWYLTISKNLAGDKDIKMTEAEVSGEPYYVLLLGGDSREDSKVDNRTDSIMVARVDEASKNVSIVSVPRDLRVNIEGHGYCKINSAIEYGGYDAVINEVNDVLDIKINYYAFIYFSGFEKLVDQLGGVTVSVPEGTYYRGVWVPSGEAVEIDGREALVLARCRHGNPPDQGAYAMGDYQRTLNQRNLIKAIAKKILTQDPAQYPALIGSLTECVETNMSVSKIISMATNMKGFDTSKMEAIQLPVCGDIIGGAWYAAMYEDVFQVVKANFKEGRKLTEGIEGFSMENNDNDLTSYCIDGPLYAYTSYADQYGSFQ